jgi:hypothetical protein
LRAGPDSGRRSGSGIRRRGGSGSCGLLRRWRRNYLRRRGRCGRRNHRLSRRRRWNQCLRRRRGSLSRGRLVPARDLLGRSPDANGDCRLVIGGERRLRHLGRSVIRRDGGGRRDQNRFVRGTRNRDIEFTGAERRRSGEEDGQRRDADQQPPGRTPLVARQHAGDGKGVGAWPFRRIRGYAYDSIRRLDGRPV